MELTHLGPGPTLVGVATAPITVRAREGRDDRQGWLTMAVTQRRTQLADSRPEMRTTGPEGCLAGRRGTANLFFSLS
jgi:hypothetical protein